MVFKKTKERDNKEMDITNTKGYGEHKKIMVKEMVATILDKERRTNKQGKYINSYFYVLTVKIDTPKYSHINKIFCSPEKVQNPQIMKDIENNKWVDRKYVFKATGTSTFISHIFWLVDGQEVIPPKYNN